MRTDGLVHLLLRRHLRAPLRNFPVQIIGERAGHSHHRVIQENLAIIGLIGKHHSPAAEVALLFPGDRYSYGIWDADLNQNVPGGYWSWNVGNLIMPEFDRDGLTDLDFEDGNAARYKVVIDTNTAIMDEKLLGQVEQYVRDGGVFIAFVQTGRHSPTQPDSWPISRLTGYRVTGIDTYNQDGSMDARRYLAVAPGQDVFAAGDGSIIRAADGVRIVRSRLYGIAGASPVPCDDRMVSIALRGNTIQTFPIPAAMPAAPCLPAFGGVMYDNPKARHANEGDYWIMATPLWHEGLLYLVGNHEPKLYVLAPATNGAFEVIWQKTLDFGDDPESIKTRLYRDGPLQFAGTGGRQTLYHEPIRHHADSAARPRIQGTRPHSHRPLLPTPLQTAPPRRDVCQPLLRRPAHLLPVGPVSVLH